ncbi:ankyrin repeat-rich membrane spanning protein [Klebsormidium nitens]|uniref:Ankyrin repeat-rich membrane spanning protein n=1 Tax=Klebsormidium nitens TaxID=105231 RepID=A0A1Y1HZ73_KLENI|nr:ankyrin repeat-rich membrane spanning protein [Klebsormidium nitens]|eukprot:GAQ83954.1 ankyrin repeat-rich membrane spanning protein [Klebsormidium nitens]
METVVEDSVRARDSNGRTALHFASGTASCQSAELLVEAGAELECKDIDGYTPLHMAAGYGREDTVNYLLGKGANPLTEDNLGRSPRELAQEIVSRGLPNQGGVKVPRGQMELVIKALINAEEKWTEAGLPTPTPGPTEPSPKRSPGSALIAASSKGDLEAVKAGVESLQKSKIKRKSDVDTALSSASRNGHKEVAAYLLEQGADVNAYDPDGATPLLAAADGGSAECVELLMRAGAIVDAKDRVGVSALIAASYNGHVDCVRKLLKHAADVNAQSHGGVTPLIAAAEGGSESCVRLLIQAGGDLEARTAEGKTALMHAVGQNITAAVEALISAGAELDGTDNEGRTALHHGARKQTPESLKALLKAGADAARRCRRGRTPLDEATPQSEAAAILSERWKELEVEATQKQERLLDELHESSAATANEGGVSRSARKKRGKKARRREKGGPGQGEVIGAGFGGEGDLGLGESFEKVRETGLESEQSGVTSLEATDGEEEPPDPVGSSLLRSDENGTDLGGSLAPGEAEGVGRIGAESGSALRYVDVLSQSEALQKGENHDHTDETTEESIKRSEDDSTVPSVREPLADEAVEISSSSEGEWVTVTSHRARKQAGAVGGRGHVGRSAGETTPRNEASKGVRTEVSSKTGTGNWSGVPDRLNARSGDGVGRATEGQVQGSGDVAAFVSKIISKQAAKSQAEERVEPEREQVEPERKQLQELERRLEEKSAELAVREKRLSEKEGGAAAPVEPPPRDKDNPWQLPRGKGAPIPAKDAPENPPEIVSGLEASSSQSGGDDTEVEENADPVAQSLVRQGLEEKDSDQENKPEVGPDSAVAELLRQSLEQKDRELLLARLEIARLLSVLAALKSTHEEELRQQRVEAHASAMAAAAASWHAWVAQGLPKPFLNPVGVLPTSSPNPSSPADVFEMQRATPRSKAVGSERSRSGGQIARTNSAGRPPPTLLRDQTAWAAALPPLPLSRAKQDSLQEPPDSGNPEWLKESSESGKPEWLKEAAAAAAVAAAAVMREKAFAQHWGVERARALLQGEKVPLVGVSPDPPPLAPPATPPPESLSGAPSVVSSGWSSRPTTAEGGDDIGLPLETDQLSESSGTSSVRSEGSLRGGQSVLTFRPPSTTVASPQPLTPPRSELQSRGLPPVSAPPGFPALRLNPLTHSALSSSTAGPPPSEVSVSTASEWVFDAAAGRMVRGSSGGVSAGPVSPEELLSQAPRLGLSATLARSRAYSSSNDLAGLSYRSSFGPAGSFGATEGSYGRFKPPQILPLTSPSTSVSDTRVGSPLGGRSSELPQSSAETGYVAGSLAGVKLGVKPGLSRWGSGFRTLSGMMRSASESHLSALNSDGGVLPFAIKTPVGGGQGWFSLVPSPSEGSEEAKHGPGRGAEVLI